MISQKGHTLLTLLLLTACNKDKSEVEDTGIGETGETGLDTGGTGETALDDEELPESTVTVEQDITWDEDVSLGSVIYIPEGVTLTVMAGINVSFQPGSGIVVDGTILLMGNEDAPVRFANDYSLSNSNYGLSVGGTADASVLNYASFTGIDVTLEGLATDLLRSATFSDATLYVLSRDTTFALEDCTFTDNARDGQPSLNASAVAEMIVKGASFSDGAYGIHFNGLADGATLAVSDSTFDQMSVAVLVGDQGEYLHNVTLSGLDISNSTDNAVALYRSDATLSNISIAGSLADGLYADALSDVVADELTVIGVDETCVHVLGGATIKRTSVLSCGDDGISLGEVGATVTDSSVSDVGNIGISAGAALSVSDTAVDGASSHGIYATLGALDTSSVTVTDVHGSGIYADQGGLTAHDTTVSDIAGNGFYVTYGDMVVSDVTADGVRGHGLYAYRGALTVEAGSSGSDVRDVEGTALYAYDGALTATDLTIYDVRGYGIYVYYEDATVSDTIISSAVSGGIASVRGDIHVFAEATGVEISDVDGVAIYANTGNITASDVEIKDVRSHGVYSAYGDTDLSDSTITNAGGTGVYAVTGSLTLDGVDIDTVAGNGVYASDGDITVTDSTVIDADSVGVYVKKGDLSVNGLTVEATGSYGVYVLGGTADDADYSGDLKDVTVSKTLGAGIVGSKADLVITDTTVSESGAQGIYVANGDLTVTDCSVTDAESHGYYVADGYLELTDSEGANVRNSGVAVAVGAASIDGLLVQDADLSGKSTGDNGVSLTDPWSGYTNSITNSVIEDVGAIGITAEQAFISYSVISGSETHGIYISGRTASSVSYTDVEDSGYYGVYGISRGVNLLDVSDCNVTGSDEYGILYVQSVDNNYVANNGSGVGADTTNTGTLDGVRDATTTQIYKVDAITNARSTTHAGTGPR